MRAAESETASIVMIGSFNPMIFQPRWLGNQQIIRAEEAASATITLINTEVADFSTEWFQLQVLHQRFQVISWDPRHYAPLRDLGSSIVNLLPHSPVTALGINRQFHFQMPSADAWHAIGHLLAPKEPWRDIIDSPSLRSMMMEGTRSEPDSGLFRVKVEPSTKVQFGVNVEVNEEFKPSSRDEGAEWVSGRLAVHWDSFMNFSESASEHLLRLI
jgi:hypothetical protein